MPTMGEVLREARQRRYVSIEQADSDTKIRKKYLIAMEEDDYPELPSPVYARGFVQIYAEYLGLDPSFVGKLYQPPGRAEPRPQIKPAASGMREGPHISLQGLVTVAVAILGVAGLFYLYSQYLAFASVPTPVPTVSSVAATPTRLAVAPSPVPTSTPTVVPTPSPTPVQGVKVEARFTDRTWLRVVADGNSVPLFEGLLEAGETRVWKADSRIDMRVGNAGGVDVTVNGMFQGKLGASGEVKNVTWGRQ